MGVGVEDSGLGVWGFVYGLERFRVQNSGFRDEGLGFRVQGLGFRVQGSGFGAANGATHRRNLKTRRVAPGRTHQHAAVPRRARI